MQSSAGAEKSSERMALEIRTRAEGIPDDLSSNDFTHTNGIGAFSFNTSNTSFLPWCHELSAGGFIFQRQEDST